MAWCCEGRLCWIGDEIIVLRSNTSRAPSGAEARLVCFYRHWQQAGSWKLRHIDTSTLWLQGHVTNKTIILEKTPGETNVADLGTKRLVGPRMLELMRLLGLHPKEGRHRLALSAGKAEGHLHLPAAASDE